MSAAPILLFLLAPLLAPGDAAPEEGGALRVVTYNIHSGIGTDGRLDLERIADVLRGADVVGLNEVDVRVPKTFFVDQAKRLADLTGMRHVFGPVRGQVIDRFGNALLSKRPILSWKNHLLPRTTSGWRRALLEADLGDMRVFVTHLSLDESERRRQVDSILAIVSRARPPVILMGDFNSRAGWPEMRKLMRTFRDAGAGTGGTWPSGEPRFRIDYILSKGFLPRRGRARCLRASDHCAFEATLAPPSSRAAPGALAAAR